MVMDQGGIRERGRLLDIHFLADCYYSKPMVNIDSHTQSVEGFEMSSKLRIVLWGWSELFVSHDR